MKLAVIASHPIQYHAPLYRLLAKELGLRVFFARIPDARSQGEGFGVEFEWDVPLTGGYESEVFAPDLLKPFDLPRIWRAASHLEKNLRRWQPDAILHTGWHHPGMVAGLLAVKRLRRPLLFRGETNLLARRAGWKLAVHKVLLSGFSKFLYIGEMNRRYYERLGLGGERMIFCPYFSDCERIALDAARLAADREGIRARWGIGAEQTCFLFCGKLETKKRPLDFARAVGMLPGCAGLIVGTGSLWDSLAGGGLHLAGFLNQSEIAAAYAAADVLVLPSDSGETWGLVVNEAMACGLPCIVSDLVGCRPDLVIERVTGLSYPCGDVGALAGRMRELAEDPALCRRMGEAARARVTSIYSVEKAAEAILAALDGVAGAASRNPP